MALEDLNLKINAPVQDAMANIKKLAAQLNDVMKTTDQIDANFRSMGDSAHLSAVQADLLATRMPAIANTLTIANGKVEALARAMIRHVGKALEENTDQAQVLEEAFTRKLIQNALAAHAQKMQMLARGTREARYEMIRLNESSQNLTSASVQAPRIAQQNPTAGGGVNFVRVASAVGQMTLLQKANTTLRNMQATIGGVTQAATVAARPIDRFRMGLAAPKVDPSLNVAKNVVTKVGEAASGAVNKLRGMADATITGIPDTLKETAKQAGNLNVELDKTSATMSKHVSKMQSTSKGLGLLSRVFPFAAGAIDKIKAPLDVATAKAEKMADALDKGNAKVAAGANTARNAAFIMTGSFENMGGSADLFARAQFHAMLPLRLFKREIDGATRVVRAATHVYNFMTAPVHKLALAMGQGRAAMQNFRASLPPLTGGLQLGTRAVRIFSHATYFSSTAVRPLIAAAVGLTRVSVMVGRGLYQVTSIGLRPFVAVTQAAVGAVGRFASSVSSTIARVTGLGFAIGIASKAFGGFGNTTNNTTNIINSRFTAIKQTNNSLFSGMISQAAMVKTALLGLAAGAVVWGASTAVAGEKNDVVFGTMLKNMDQGKAVVDSLQATDAAKLFDNEELLNSGRLIFKAGVSAADLGAKTNQLATIATATSTELNDLSRIYQQGANAGSFGQDKINQLAERGIDIYHGLEAATGVSGSALQKMISEGQIGLTEMDAALAHLTEGNGIYAGALQNVAGTAGGMMSQMKNNTQQALGALMGAGLAAFKPILAAGVRFTEGLKTTVIALQPVFSAMFTALYMYATGAWTLITNAASSALQFIFGEGDFTFSSITTFLASMMGAATYIFGNMGTIASYAWKFMQLGAMMAFNDFVYFFTDTIPAYLSWFADNWANVFVDAGMVVATVFTNIAKNIGSAMTAIWDFIASGGTAKLQFAFVPLLDGFKSTLAELPNVPERALTQMEQQLTAELGALGTEIGTGLADSMAAATAAIGTQTQTELSDKAAAASAGAADAAASSTSKAATENKAALVRSSEGQSVVAQFAKAFNNDKQNKALQAQINSEKHLEDLARKAKREGNGLKARPTSG
jgi:tape measure domain-containing protein